MPVKLNCPGSAGESMPRIALCQTNPVTGDLEGNVRQILRDIERARRSGAEIALFPEAAITGYCCGALFEQERFIRDNLAALDDIAAAVPQDMLAVVGFVDCRGREKSGALRLTSSAALLQGGRSIGAYDKMLLANEAHHEDRKYFTPGDAAKVFEVMLPSGPIRVGTPICEDAWAHQHERDVIAEMVAGGAELILCLNQSYFHHGKQQLRRELFGTHAAHKGVPVAAVNASGVGDIVKNIMLYDGGSLAFNAQGEQLAELARFAPDFSVISLDGPAVRPRERGKEEELHDALLFAQREVFRCLGIPNAQVHLSGGVDSALVAALVAEAMGPEHTVLISNPTEDNGPELRAMAQAIADNLTLPLYWNDSQAAYESIVRAHTAAFGAAPSPKGRGCIEAVLRTAQGVGAYHHFRSGIVATGNHTEIVEGWATFHDIGSIGVHALIGDLTKTEVYALARYVNQRAGHEIIPAQLYDGRIRPAAELADANEDPLDYFVRAGICAELVRCGRHPDDIIERFRRKELDPQLFPEDWSGRSVYRHTEEEFSAEVWEAFRNAKASVFKSAQGAPVVLVSPRSRGFSSRETVINHYSGGYRRRS